MANRQLTITELRRIDAGFVDTAVQFIWTAEEQSAPRGPWKFGVEQRSVREDYPGADAPVEQVLGWNFKPFSLTGVWDDRYMGAGAALDTYRKFEALTQRGNLVRVEFETISFIGLLKGVEFDYKRASYIGYTFEISPHSRKIDGDSSLRNGIRSPRVLEKARITAPTEHRDKAASILNDMVASHATAPAKQMTGDTHSGLSSMVTSIQQRLADVVSVIDQRLDQASTPFAAFQRIAQTFGVLKTECQIALTNLQALRSDADMAWQSAVEVLEFEVWLKGQLQFAREGILTSHNAQRDMALRATPKVVATYNPHRGESLYAIALRFYGNADQWKLIAERNGLVDVILQGTETLIIPEVMG